MTDERAARLMGPDEGAGRVVDDGRVYQQSLHAWMGFIGLPEEPPPLVGELERVRTVHRELIVAIDDALTATEAHQPYNTVLRGALEMLRYDTAHLGPVVRELRP